MSSVINASTIEQKESNNNGVKRLIFVILSFALEFLLIFALFFWLNMYAQWIMVVTRILAAVLAIYIYNRNIKAAMKLPWIILILVLPIFGIMLYLLIGMSISTKDMKERYRELDEILFPYLPENRDVLGRLDAQDRRAANIARYIHAKAGYPIYDNTDIVYYDDAAAGLEAQKEELRKAEKFIFMEYHAIENAESWHGIQEILEERAKAGVDVRVFYDDMGSIGFINMDFVNLMTSRGIRCRVFNPFVPGLKIFLNNRDHRKITVIDGKVGFTGGYNLANEYFHITEPFGYWKDTGIKLTGDAVKSLTVTFLEMWNAVRADDENDTDYDSFFPDTDYRAEEDGFVVPYADLPIDEEHVGEEVYMSVASYAKDYAWFITPYLILTDEMVQILSLAAKQGVDVRIITPGIPDKKLVYSITRSYYNCLVVNGVRIFEYTPGFCHAKMSIADDRIATCGTINLDYRSLYHHFENGCLFAGQDAVLKVRDDFQHMFEESTEVTEEYRNPKTGWKLIMLFLRLFSPLL